MPSATALAPSTGRNGQMPDRPEINDTLGWICYRKDLVDHAIPLLAQSVDARPDHAA